MALFKSLFSKKDKLPKGFSRVAVREVKRLTPEAVQIVLDKEPQEMPFIPGQYLNFIVNINGKELRRSYSICSGPNEPLSVAVKEVPDGTVSVWFNREVAAGDELIVSKAEGSFTVPSDAKNIVAIAAGSGITPILSIAKSLENSDRNLRLFYGNRSLDKTLFKTEIDVLKNTYCQYYLSGEEHPDHQSGRIDKEAFSAVVKADLSILKSDCFLLCGPEQMILDVAEVLEMFGVPKTKIRYELFTTPVLMKSEASEAPTFDGEATVTVYLDDEKETFTLHSGGASILEAASEAGLDVPYSCRGGVCSTCKAKLLKGHATMHMNYVLTDREVEQGYILTCQAHPNSPELEITYDV